ncbi:unnamed protein product, partial [Anisakis simplex]|uniref:Ku_N domain-containing protein n=1 Tax=Anisakis simplex TaxID=6269 RepID=A0A0M3JFS0_ANISI
TQRSLFVVVQEVISRLTSDNPVPDLTVSQPNGTSGGDASDPDDMAPTAMSPGSSAAERVFKEVVEKRCVVVYTDRDAELQKYSDVNLISMPADYRYIDESKRNSRVVKDQSNSSQKRSKRGTTRANATGFY